MAYEARDWVAWHQAYNDPSSRLSRRLLLVQEHLHRAIDATPGPLQIISMCAGEGRDVVSVLEGHPRREEITALLVELDPQIADAARAAATAAGLTRMAVLTADAGLTDSYAEAVPADVVLVCGVFGNIADDDVRRTIAHLPCLCAPGATVIWTRGKELHRDFALTIRDWFAVSGFDELALEAPAGATFRVGVNRLAVAPRPFEPGVRLFTFLR
jgi:hypothetical protein